MNGLGFYAPILIFLGVALVIVPGIVISRVAQDRAARIRAGEVVLTDKYSGLAIASIVVVLIGALPGVVLGHLALAQVNRTHERGWGLAVAALYLGYLGLVVIAIVIAVLASLR